MTKKKKEPWSLAFHCLFPFILTENMMWLCQALWKAIVLLIGFSVKILYNSIGFVTLLACHYWELVQYETGLLAIIAFSHLCGGSCLRLVYNSAQILQCLCLPYDMAYTEAWHAPPQIQAVSKQNAITGIGSFISIAFPPMHFWMLLFCHFWNWAEHELNEHGPNRGEACRGNLF